MGAFGVGWQVLSSPYGYLNAIQHKNKLGCEISCMFVSVAEAECFAIVHVFSATTFRQKVHSGSSTRSILLSSFCPAPCLH